MPGREKKRRRQQRSKKTKERSIDGQDGTLTEEALDLQVPSLRDL